MANIFFPWNIKYPDVNDEVLNLDWLLRTLEKAIKDINDFIGINTIKYADPILWDITRQYEANTLVVDGHSGNAFISTKAVPAGVHLNNSEYWTQIYNYADVVDTLRSQIAYNEKESTTATRNYAINDLVFTNGILYRVISPMIAGDSFVPNSNVTQTTINTELLREILARDNAINNAVSTINDIIGRLSDLDTSIKSSIVAAINSEVSDRELGDQDLKNQIGHLSSLETSVTTDLVSAINSELSDREAADTTLQSNIDNVRELIATVSYDYIVDINGSGDYTSLASCVNDAPSGSKIFVKKGTYNNEVVNCVGKKLYITGEDKFSTIIQNNYDDYNRAPLNIGKGVVSNISFKSTGTSGTAGQHAYAVHVDNVDLYQEELTFIDCFMQSASVSAVGVGTRNDCKLTFDNCLIETTDATSDAMYIHPAGNSTYGGNNQMVYLTNCIIHSRGNVVLHISKIGDASNNTYITAIGTVLQTNTLNRTGLIWQTTHDTDSQGGVYFIRGAGNSYPLLNQDTFVPGQQRVSGRYLNQAVKTVVISDTLTAATQKSMSLPSDCSYVVGLSGIFRPTGSSICYPIAAKAANTTDYHEAYFVETSKTLYAISSQDANVVLTVDYISDADTYI